MKLFDSCSFKYLITIFCTVFCMAIYQNGYAKDSTGLLIFSAASTTNAIMDIGTVFEKNHLGHPRYAFAASSTLARQIYQGAPANVYICANTKWMDYLEDKGMLAQHTRFDLMRNRIVLIAPKDSTLSLSISPELDLKGIIGMERIAMGDPAHVPAGIYGKQALESLNLWEKIKSRVARSKDVRAALALVEKEETPLGIVYATDAAISSKVRVVDIFPDKTHSPIVYPAALVKGQVSPAAVSFLKFLKAPQAQIIFKKYGFLVH